ncbi:DUF3973 domain-containing protein [Paenibacillus solisilvae]|uniref:DUF3973 domain-containing protein n=1 Tax=Paenibacillus solisilvae TaxID=2486751 RepID=A0ABW0W109_9BACL
MFFCVNCRTVHFTKSSEDTLFKTAFHYLNGEKIATGLCTRSRSNFLTTSYADTNISTFLVREESKMNE